MLPENTTKLLVETIDNAIEQAEDLQRSLIVRILMMARLEADRPEEATPERTVVAKHGHDRH